MLETAQSPDTAEVSAVEAATQPTLTTGQRMIQVTRTWMGKHLRATDQGLGMALRALDRSQILSLAHDLDAEFGVMINGISTSEPLTLGALKAAVDAAVEPKAAMRAATAEQVQQLLS